MRFRKPRIAWSVFWGLACVLLIVLWVRSYWWVDMASGPVTAKLQFGIASIPGGCLIQTSNPISSATWTTGKQQTDDSWRIMEKGGLLYDSRILGGVAAYKSGFLVITYGFLVSVAICVGVAPWLRWRFTLRTLLIATTLVAVVLGFVVWLASK